MPIRKKKSSGALKNTSPHDNTQPSTSELETKDGSQSKIKRKARRASTKKSTTKDSTSDKVDAAANELRQNQTHYDHFLLRMDMWIRKNSHKILTVMKRFDHDQEGLVTYDEFKSAMFDIDAPCNAVELHLLCKTLDTYEEKDIDYTMLHVGLSSVRNTEEGADSDSKSDNKSLNSTLSTFPSEPEVTRLVQWMGNTKTYTLDTPRYALVHFRHITFAKDKHHSSHVTEVVEVNTCGLSLAEIIQQKTQTPVSLKEFKLFIGRQCTKEQQFPPGATLWQHGCKGGPRSQPEPVLLYYNYATVLNDCPLLMCDYYINLITTRNRDMLAMRHMPPSNVLLRKKSTASRNGSDKHESN